MPGKTPTAYFVYMLRCADATLYTGSTNDLAAREVAHNAGRGAKSTAGRRPVRIVYSEEHESRSAAQRREYELKCWTRARKEALVAGGGSNGLRLLGGCERRGPGDPEESWTPPGG